MTDAQFHNFAKANALAQSILQGLAVSGTFIFHQEDDDIAGLYALLPVLSRV